MASFHDDMRPRWNSGRRTARSGGPSVALLGAPLPIHTDESRSTPGTVGHPPIRGRVQLLSSTQLFGADLSNVNGLPRQNPDLFVLMLTLQYLCPGFMRASNNCDDDLSSVGQLPIRARRRFKVFDDFPNLAHPRAAVNASRRRVWIYCFSDLLQAVGVHIEHTTLIRTVKDSRGQVRSFRCSFHHFDLRDAVADL